MRQEVTRAHKGWSLDSVMLHNDVTKWAREDINNPPAVSCYTFVITLTILAVITKYWQRSCDVVCCISVVLQYATYAGIKTHRHRA